MSLGNLVAVVFGLAFGGALLMLSPAKAGAAMVGLAAAVTILRFPFWGLLLFALVATFMPYSTVNVGIRSTVSEAILALTWGAVLWHIFLSRLPPAPALRAVASAETAQSPLGREELNDLMDYGNERMTNSHCSLDPFRREIRVTALTDDKVLLMTSCESGAYNPVWLAWLVSRQRPYVARQVRLTLPFQPPGEAPREIELINASYDDRRHELVTLDKGRGAGDCGIQTRWRFDGQRFSLSRYAQQPTCDNWQGPDAWPTLWITR